MEIKYENSEIAWAGFQKYVENLILRTNAKRVCEIGGGANPSLPVKFIIENGLEYTVIDISEEELSKAPDGYLKVQADIAADDFHLSGEFDLVFSKMLAEHVKNGRRFHENILNLLNPNGLAFHFFPTLFAPPFVLNRLMPESISEKLLLILQPGRHRSGKKGKFPAYYDWCRGPIHSQIKKFEEVGYKVEKYIGFYGHGEYYKKFPFIRIIHVSLCNTLIKFPIPWITSFAYIVLKK